MARCIMYPPDEQLSVALSDIRDLSDFHLNWTSFRSIAAGLTCTGSRLAIEERLVVEWLVRLADRVGEADLLAEADD